MAALSRFGKELHRYAERAKAPKADMSRSRIATDTLVVLLLSARIGIAQSAAVSTALTHLTSTVDSVRHDSMSELRQAATAARLRICAPDATSVVKQTLIDALAQENARIFVPGADFTDAETEFHADLIGCVAVLHDLRAAHVLANALDTGGGATNGLLALGGDVAAPELAAILRSTKPRIELSVAAVDVAGQITAPGSHVVLSNANRSVLRSALVATLGDSHAYVRSVAVGALRSFPDEEVRRLMVHIAASDTDTVDRAGRRVEGAASAARAWLRDSGTHTRVSP